MSSIVNKVISFYKKNPVAKWIILSLIIVIGLRFCWYVTIPIVISIYLWKKFKKGKEIKKNMKNEILITKCPKCKMEVDPEAIKCPYCRTKLKHSKIIQAFVVIVFVGIIISILIADSNSNTTPDNTIVVPVAKPVVTKNATPQKQISYEVIKRWEIPNGGEGKVIVISPTNLNETDMVLLGTKLKNDTLNDKNSFVYVFDDKKAALLRDSVINDTASKAEKDLYDKHFIGTYKKNGNSGFHQFDIYFDGVMGTNQKTIKY